MCIRKNALSYDFFQQLPTALQKANGVICLGETVVRFGGLRDDHDRGLGPWVISKRNRSIVDLKESVRTGSKGPL